MLNTSHIQHCRQKITMLQTHLPLIFLVLFYVQLDVLTRVFMCVHLAQQTELNVILTISIVRISHVLPYKLLKFLCHINQAIVKFDKLRTEFWHLATALEIIRLGFEGTRKLISAGRK